MKHKAMLLFVMGLISVSLAQPAAQNQTPTQSISMMKSREAYDLLKKVNDEMGLVPKFGGGPVQYNSLRAKNCFGFRFASNQSILGESSGEDYDLTFYSPNGTLTGVVIGHLYSEMAFMIQDKHYSPGGYVVLLGPEKITVAGVDLEGEDLPLSSKVDDAGLTSKRRPKFSFVQEGDSIFLVILGDRFSLRPEEKKSE